MKIQNLISRFVDSYRKSVRRFSLTFAVSIVLALLICYCIIIDDIEDIQGYLMMALCSGMLLSLLLTLVAEKYGFSRLIPAVITAVYVVACTWLLNRFENNVFTIMTYAGVNGALFCLVAYEVFLFSGTDNTFGYLVSQGFYTVLLTSVVMAGVCICIAAFTNLIYDFNDSYKLYLIAATLIYLVIGVNHYLACLPEDGDEVSVPKVYSLVFNKAALAIYLLLLAILYIYLFKSIITMNLPRGRINIFASLALLMFCGYYLSVRCEDSPAHQSYLRLGGWLMLPVVLIQAVAVYIRIDDLGVTAPRWLSLACDVIALLFIADSLFVHRVNWLFLAMAAVCLLVTVGPLNCLTISNRWQQQIIENVLKRNNMLDYDNAVIPNSTISYDDQKKLLSAYDYLYYQEDETLSQRQKYLISKDPEVLYGFGYEDHNPYVHSKECWWDAGETAEFDVAGYRTMKNVSYYGFEANRQEVIIEGYDLTEQLRSFVNGFDEDNRPEHVRFAVDDGVIEVLSIYAACREDGTFEHVRLSGYLLRK